MKDRNRTEIMEVRKYIRKIGTLEEFVEEVGLAVAELLRDVPCRSDSEP
jgi:hypothetical protein